MSFNIAKAISALQNILWLILVMGFVSLVQAQVIGEDLVLQDMTIGGGEDETYEATNTITTAGENDVGAPTTFVVKAGGRATLKARTRIELKAGTQLELGASFRAYIDPNAGNPTSSPTITILEPDGVGDTADQSYSITWSDEDPDSDASIFLFYDTDNVEEDGTPINLSPISEDDETDSFTWDTSEVLEGDYYVYGTIDDSVNPAVVDYSEGPVKVDHNDRPTIGGVPGTIVDEDTAYSFTPTANDADEGDTLEFDIVNQPSWASFDEATGRLWGIPGNGDVGVTTDIVITVMDDSGEANDRASLPAFNLTVLNVNDPPVAVDDDRNIPEDGQIWINVVANDTDVDDENGDLKIASFDLESDEGGEVIQPQPPEGDPNERVLRYTPKLNFNGEDGFNYVVEDPAGGTSTGRVTITVIAVNDPPMPVDDSGTTNEDSNWLWINVLGNDKQEDPDGNGSDLRVTSFTQGAKGEVDQPNPDGNVLRYRPYPDKNGLDSFTYVVRDNEGNGEAATGRVNVTIIPVNDPPVAVDDSGTVVEDSNAWLWINVRNNDNQADPDGGGDLWITSFTQGTKGEVDQPSGPNSNALRYRPYSDEEGEDSFTYVVRDDEGDGEAATGTVTVTITPLNDAPTISGDPATGVDAGAEYRFTPTANDVDEGDMLEFDIVNRPSWASFDSSTGTLTGTPPESDIGLYEDIQITVTDDSEEENDSASLAAFNLTVLKGAQAVAPWKILSSRTGTEETLYFGQHGDTPVACDYDGDGITDLAVWRTFRNPAYGNGPRSMWIIRQSSNDQTMVEYFGDLDGQYPADVPVQADYDGDRRCDMAYFDDTGGGGTGNTWHIKKSSNGNTITRTWNPSHQDVNSHEHYPANDDFRRELLSGEWSPDSAVPAPADYDGDGIADLGAFWPFMAAWTYRPSSGGADVEFTYGMPGEEIFAYPFGDLWDIYDLPVPADYIEDGEDKAQPATWRPKDTQWSVQGQPTVEIGRGLEVPVTGDFDGDGIADPTVFVQRPDITMEHVSNDITADGEWPGRHGEQHILDDNGTYRMTYCGESPVRGAADDIYYSESSSPTSEFPNPRRIILNSCEHTHIKVPSTINPVFEGQCGAENSVHLLYTASERWNLTNATFHPPDPDDPNGGDHDEAYRWPQPVDQAQDPTLWPARIGNASAWVWEGLKIVLYSACDNLARPQSWVRRGPVFQIPELDPPDSGSDHDPIGTQHPNAIYQDGIIYLSVYYDEDVGGNTNAIRTHLAVSIDGLDFTDTGESGVKRSSRVHKLDESNSIIGHTFNAAIEFWTGPEAGGYSTESSAYVHFSKDLGNLKTPSLKNQYRHVDHLLRMPKGQNSSTGEDNTCSYAPGVLESPHGFVEGNSTYVYANEWIFNYYCTCRAGKPTDFDDPETGEPDLCPHRLRDNGTWSLETGEIGVSRVDFNFVETGCIGNRYSSCADGSCIGVQRMRTCTAEDTWGEWVDLE